jgi:hypothetical protein
MPENKLFSSANSANNIADGYIQDFLGFSQSGFGANPFWPLT